MGWQLVTKEVWSGSGPAQRYYLVHRRSMQVVATLEAGHMNGALDHFKLVIKSERVWGDYTVMTHERYVEKLSGKCERSEPKQKEFTCPGCACCW